MAPLDGVVLNNLLSSKLFPDYGAPTIPTIERLDFIVLIILHVCSLSLTFELNK